jgi:hypothetical protein
MAISTWFEFVSHARGDTGGGNAVTTLAYPKDAKGAPAAKGVLLCAETGDALIRLDGTDPAAGNAVLRIPAGAVPFYLPIADKDIEFLGSVASTKLHATWVR